MKFLFLTLFTFSWANAEWTVVTNKSGQLEVRLGKDEYEQIVKRVLTLWNTLSHSDIRACIAPVKRVENRLVVTFKGFEGDIQFRPSCGSTDCWFSYYPVETNLKSQTEGKVFSMTWLAAKPAAFGERFVAVTVFINEQLEPDWMTFSTQYVNAKVVRRNSEGQIVISSSSQHVYGPWAHCQFKNQPKEEMP
jgi:hypothetical protein